MTTTAWGLLTRSKKGTVYLSPRAFRTRQQARDFLNDPLKIYFSKVVQVTIECSDSCTPPGPWRTGQRPDQS